MSDCSLASFGSGGGILVYGEWIEEDQAGLFKSDACLLWLASAF
jgi:hypothetical protein